MQPIINNMLAATFPEGAADLAHVSVTALDRLLFVIGHCAVHQLVRCTRSSVTLMLNEYIPLNIWVC